MPAETRGPKGPPDQTLLHRIKNPFAPQQGSRNGLQPLYFSVRYLRFMGFMAPGWLSAKAGGGDGQQVRHTLTPAIAILKRVDAALR